MIKVTFELEGELVNYFGVVARLVKANFIFCKSVVKYSRVLVPTIKDDILYIPRTREFIKSIEHVKPTDL